MTEYCMFPQNSRLRLIWDLICKTNWETPRKRSKWRRI